MKSRFLRLPILFGLLFFLFSGFPVIGQEECIPPGSPDRVRIASLDSAFFNSEIEPSRSSVTTMARVLRAYDLIALRDITAKGESRLSTLVGVMNKGRECYKLLRSDPVGESRGSYLYVYNQFRIKLVGGPYSFDADQGNFRQRIDAEGEANLPLDIYAWEPYIAYFETLDGAFDFSVMNNHVTESATQAEIDMLPVVTANAIRRFTDPDVLLLGDMRIQENGGPEFPEGAFTRIARPEGGGEGQQMLITSSMELEYTGEAGAFPFSDFYEESGALQPIDSAYDTRILYAEFRKSEDRD